MSALELATKTRKQNATRVLIFDLCPLFRNALASLIDSIAGFKVVAQADCCKEAMQILLQERVDLIVADLDAGNDALILLSHVKTQYTSRRCVMTLTDGHSAELLDAIRMQADGLLSKRLTAEEFVRQFALIRAGQMVISDALTNTLAVSLRNGSLDENVRDIQCLSGREREVLHCLAAGKTNQTIGEELGITIGTVKVHVKHILKKLNFSSRVEAALWASKR